MTKPVLAESTLSLDFPIFYANGKQTCLSDYPGNKICPFLQTFLGAKFTCTVDGGHLYRENGFLVPSPSCILRGKQ